MSHRLNQAMRANKQLCRLNRAPVLAAELAAICLESSVNQTPVLTLALGDLLVADKCHPLGNPALRATLARAVVAFYKSQRPSLTAIQLKAMTYSEMTMSCAGEASGTLAEVTEARQKLKAMLRARPPTDAEVQTVFTTCWDNLSKLPAASAYRVEDLEGFAEARPEYIDVETVNQRVYQAWAHGCGVFNPDVVRPAAAKAVWTLVTSIVTPTVTAGGCDMSLSDTDKAAMSIDYEAFLEIWARGSLEFYCGFYDAQAWVEKASTERDVVHALFTCLAHLSKGQNKTNAWISSRFRRVQEHIMGLGDLDAPVVQEFSKMHGGTKMSSEQIFAALAAAYKCLTDTPAASLCWVIEQSVASNITGALIVADVISKMQFFPLASIIGKVIPEVEFKALVRLAMHTLVSKFGSLAGPTVTVKEYADVAHLALAIHKKGLRGPEKNSLVDYAGEYTQYLKLNKVDLEAMATNIQAISAGTAASSVSLTALIRLVGPRNAIIGELDGDAVVYEDLGPMHKAQDDDLIEAPIGAIPQSQLSAEMRRNRRYYKAQSVQSMLHELQDNEDAKIKAFRTLMGDLSTCGIQSSAYFADMLATKYQLPYSQPPQDTVKMFQLWLGDEANDYLKTHSPRGLSVAGGPEVNINEPHVYPNYPVVTPTMARPDQPHAE